jgi:Cap4-like dsDNA endonuclease family protein
MSKQGRSSSSRKLTPQSTSFGISPDEVLDTVDTGDETQHRFRYQHAYGVILLLAALSSEKPYTALWCEHHEDLLGQRNDGFFDAYQIKTRRNGLWNLSDDPVKDSIKRFVEVDQRFPGKIKEFFFVSNAGYENNNAQNRAGRSPKRFLQAVKDASSPSDLTPPFNTAFEELRSHCHCEPLSLMTVLKKLNFLSGPGLDSFEAEIAQDHLSAIPQCRDLSAPPLAQLLDELIAKVYKASGLNVSDPARHWYDLTKNDHGNPTLQAKRIAIESALSFIGENRFRLLNLIKDAPVLSGRVKETLELYLAQSFEDDRVAKLDQAGETDQERSTLLHQVFVDLELKPRSDQPRPPRRFKQGQLPPFAESEQLPEIALPGGEKSLSAMDCFLKELSSNIVIIGDLDKENPR